jgi:hypothetical protein
MALLFGITTAGLFTVDIVDAAVKPPHCMLVYNKTFKIKLVLCRV